MNGSTPERLRELEVLFARCRYRWRDLFYELEQGEVSLLAEDPWSDVDALVELVAPEHATSFTVTLEEMVRGDDPVAQTQALSIIAACEQPFDLAIALANEPNLKKDLEAHLALLLAIGERRFAPGRAIVEKALLEHSRRHAALIALAQLEPAAAAPHGLAAYKKDRERIVQTLIRPLAEHEYATFYQMAEGVLEVQGKDGLNVFLRAVAGKDEAVLHELAQLGKRLLLQAEAALT